MRKRFALPAASRAVVQQMEEPPPVVLPEDRAVFLAGVETEHQTEAEDHFNHLTAFDEHRRWDMLTQAITSINNVLKQGDGGRFQKPLLTLEEAASMLSLSPKRFKNIICEERARLGRSPDFLCDANGRICCRVLRDELLEWARGRNRKTGRAVSVRRHAV